MSKSIYCDHNATTPPDERVIKKIAEISTRVFGNPSSPHRVGQEAKGHLEESRAVVADFLGAQPSEIVFTGSGTEADNLAIFGAAYANQDKGRHLITSAIEHHAVLAAFERLAELGWETTILPVDSQGLVNPADLKSTLRDDTALVSIMTVNNEVGTIQPIEQLAAITRERGVLFHTDAVQAAGKIPVEINKPAVDLLTISAHKIYGPKGVGALYVRAGTNIEPHIFGGGQEAARRSGTENLPSIVGFAEAVKLLSEKSNSNDQAAAVGEEFLHRLRDAIDDVRLHGHPDRRVTSTINVGFAGINGEALLIGLDLQGICVSSGSACSTGAIEPSHVLTAMGCDRAAAESSLRFSFGRLNDPGDLDYLITTIADEVDRLRRLSPTYRAEQKVSTNGRA